MFLSAFLYRCLAASLVAAAAALAGPLEIRFATPATDWESQALPIGNGRVGAMIYGSPLAERMQFNEITLWTGGANPSGGYDVNSFGAYQNFGDLYLEEGAAGPTVSWPTLADHMAASSTETVAKSVDGSVDTKWCFEHLNKTVIWQASYPAPVVFTGYSLASANDVAARDPKTWTFEGSNDGSSWTQLDSRNLSAATTPVWPFPNRKQTVNFTAATSGAYTHYRFVFAPNTAVPHFQVAEITLTPALTTAVPANLVRSLDVADSIHRVTWIRNGVNFLRESFASHPHQIIATRFSADQAGKISTSFRLVGAHAETTVAAGSEIGFAAVLSNNGLRYATRVRVLHTGGSLTVSGNTLRAENCDSLVILHAAATDYALDATTTPAFRNGINPAVPVAARLNAAQALGYDGLKTAHLADYHALFNRVTLDLGAAPAETLTPARLTAYKAGGTDRHLESLLFQFGRYLLISCSRDSLPANLQGLWNNSNNPPWFSDYHVNINLQMNYWMAEPANLSECHEPLFRYLGAIAPLSRTATKASFGAETPGWTMRTSVNPFGGHGWDWDTPSSAWLARHYWEHYAHSGDTAFLQGTAWPVMKEICEFWIARLVTRPDGKLVGPNGWSPEHGPTEDGVSYVQEIVWDLFSNTIAAADVLGIEPEFRALLADKRSRLLVPGIGSWGQVMEWTTERPTIEHDGHRHTSHLYAAYPGSQFNPVETPAYVAAAKISLQDRGTTGDSRRSWTWPWRAALWARLGDPNKAYDMVRGLLTYNTMSNLYTTHTPFQIDGNLGFPAAVCEMLVQSHAGEVSVLPALPSAWASGSFTGIRARGGYEVDAAWQGGIPTALAVRSSRAQAIKLRLPASISSPGAFVRSGNSVRSVTRQNGVLDFPAEAGASYQIDTRVNDTGDADGDGFNTEAEWLAGTDPARGDSLPRLRVTRTEQSLGLEWNEIPGREYILQSSADLDEWTDLITRQSTAETTASHPLPAGEPDHRFYRISIRLGAP
ncbi:glycoside hydrolase family 95 protein [Luteolibacter arcticus]|uniref:Glycoside hydrolase family 95 protein n=1 Tax=Luteolibacter arcticus TaxID=1581411 RepID=A0ABT3GR75_9BACT|nr:glycoside hydrolase family 95 protein [Luteolibacter arcticus]MCW1925985.1 glycoside hydrolase family 95 protein [Luteolibacter arcticus]